MLVSVVGGWLVGIGAGGARHCEHRLAENIRNYFEPRKISPAAGANPEN
jgi:hypothetical protein